ncbi:MAG: flagellar hook-basal body complex protein FliE [Pseudomonadota bacterium]|jgi:flagellar hook-basal body complex protein FliE
MSISGIDPRLPNFAPIKGVGEIKGAEPKSGVQGSGFGELFENAIKEVNSLQNQADEQIEGLVLKKDGVTPHSAMMALEKADVAFQLMSAIRGKIVRAYEEVIRTQV